jgi:hypothetical protein
MRRVRPRLTPRWNSILGNINVVVDSLRRLLPNIKRETNRGQPPKHPLKDYLILIAVKEYKRSSLRFAETDWSELVCGERVDHSVIAYWERNMPRESIERAVCIVGSRLEELIGYDFSMIDATPFSNWHHDTQGFHLVNRICRETVYPVSMKPDTLDPIPDTRDTIVPGSGLFMADKWYDVNGVFRVLYNHGYTPLIKPQRTRCSGHWRRKGRKVYGLQWRKYRHRGRGESVFGSLTNAYGDRLNTRTRITTYTRSCARVMAYQVKIYIRAIDNGSVMWWVNN